MRVKVLLALMVAASLAGALHSLRAGERPPVAHQDAQPAQPDTAAAQLFHTDVQPLLKRYCYECHGDGNSAGDLELDAFASSADVIKSQQTWQKIISYARTQVMPPPEAEVQLDQKQRDTLVAALQRQLYDPSRPDPGHVTLRRLSRTEYRNTVRDLLGIALDPAQDFPEDDTGYGFDNIADVLTLPPMLMEKYLRAAEKSLDEAIPTQRLDSREQRVAATDARGSFKPQERPGAIRDEAWVALNSTAEDSLSFRTEIAAPADYALRVLAYAEAPGDAPVKLSLMLGDAVAREVPVTATAAAPQWYEARLGVPIGRQTFRVAVRRQRGLAGDTTVSSGRVGAEQPGQVFIKEIVIEGPVRGAVQRFTGDQLTPGGKAGRQGDSIFMPMTGDQASTTLLVPADAEYLLRVQACSDFAGAEPAKMQLRIDGEPLKVFEVDAPAQSSRSPGENVSDRARRAVPHVYELRTPLKAGRRELSVRFLNDLYTPEHEHPNYRDRNLIVQHIEAVEVSADPLSPPMTAPLRTMFVRHAGELAAVTNAAAQHDPSAARALLKEFTLRAWRRPAEPKELDRLMQLYATARGEGEGFHASVKHAMKGVLVSSSFLFRGAVGDGRSVDRPPQPVDEFELASRLSYFLWSSMPDDELLDLAQRRELRQQLQPQLQRMLKSPKAQALVQNFIGQWLQFRNLDAAHPDPRRFDAYNDRLRDAMKRETQLFFESLVREDRSLLDTLTADYTFLNERLAKHYGIIGVLGEEFRRVSLVDTPRRGVLTHGSVLTLTSNPTRTSPVKRGKWVLENLLGTAPPPPPPDIPPLTRSEELKGTLRQRMEQHRADATCASCHAPMDPIGFALENFDGIGRWRAKDGDTAIDAKSELPDGTTVTGAMDLAPLLASTRRNDFFRSATEAALTFALGRGVEPFDQPSVDRIVDMMNHSDGRFSSLIQGIVESVPFQMQRAPATGAAATGTAARADAATQEGG